MRLSVRLFCLVLCLFLVGGSNAFAFTSAVPDRASKASTPAGTAKAPVSAKALGAEPATAKAPSTRAAGAFRGFEKAFSGTQGVEWSKDSDSPRSVWGFKSGRIAGKAEDVAKAFLGKYQGLFGTDGSDLATEKSVERLGIRHVRFQQYAAGVPVEGAYVAVHMDSGGRVMMADSTYKTGLKVDTANRISDRQATAAVKSDLGKNAKPSSVSLVALPTGRGTASLAYKAETKTKKPAGNWTQLIDAKTGKIVSSYNDIRFANQATEKVRSVQAPEGVLRQALPAPVTTSGQGAAVVPRATSTLTNQGFEGAWPAPYWSVYVVPPSSTAPIAFWGKTTYMKTGGSYSIWPARLGPAGKDPALYYYPNNLSSFAVFGPFNLSNATAATAQFQLWNESEQNFDYFYWLAGDGNNYSGWRTSGNSGGGSAGAWTTANLNMGSEDEMGDMSHLLGESNVYLMLWFRSDSSVVDDGPFVDDLLIQKTVADGSPGTTSGTYSGYVYPVNGFDTPTLAPLANQYVVVGPNRATTNVSGSYSTPIAGNITAWLKGPYAQAVNADYYANQMNTASATWDYRVTGPEHADEVNLFYHVNKVHDYFKSIGCYVMDYTMRAWAHIGSSYDNAYYDGSVGNVYFGDGSYPGDPDGLRDTARGNDVIYHEYTHGVCDHILDLPYVLQSGAMSEGYADYFAGSFTNDPVMGQYVFPSAADQRDMEQATHEMSYASQGIRNTYTDPEPTEDWWALGPGVLPSHASDATYNDGGWVHHNNMIFSGALWDIRNAMTTAHGTAGPTMADKIILESMYFWPYSLESSVRAMLMSDDLLYGNNKWTDGSPHSSQVISGAVAHGFDPVWTSYLSSTTSITSPTHGHYRQYATIAGYVRPAVVGAPSGQNSYGARMTVGIYRYYSGRYRRVATLYTRLRAYSSTASRYSVRYRTNARGRWRAVAYFPGSEEYITGKSVRPSTGSRYFRVY